ncbi:MAG: Abi family protein [Oscillospiraceae bacterium]|nr:Abi family protein [Oscillospiraceae bacterium]
MTPYPKKILSINQQLQTYKDAGMEIVSSEDALIAIETIGYYRLRGYCYYLYDNKTKKYQEGTTFDDVLNLYKFDTELSHLLFSLSSAIEVSLRAHLSEALLQAYNDPLALYDPSIFADKSLYWKNIGTLSNEIARSNDVFIAHNFKNHDGMIPIWAAVEVMSFGNLSMTIKNLKTGKGSAAQKLLSHYRIMGRKGEQVTPSFQMLASWIQSVSVIRNICAHNGRIYNRTISASPQIPSVDVPPKPGKYSGVYQIVLSMKYLRPSDSIWNKFVLDLTELLQRYDSVVDLKKINFPIDWKEHLTI